VQRSTILVSEHLVSILYRILKPFSELLEKSKLGEEVLRVLASNPDFASSPDRPFDIVKNVVTVLVTHGVNYSMWLKQLPFFPPNKTMSALAQDSKGLEVVVHMFASDAHSHNKESKLSMSIIESIADLPGEVSNVYAFVSWIRFN
jgi:hypothetical protein